MTLVIENDHTSFGHLQIAKQFAKSVQNAQHFAHHSKICCAADFACVD